MTDNPIGLTKQPPYSGYLSHEPLSLCCQCLSHTELLMQTSNAVNIVEGKEVVISVLEIIQKDEQNDLVGLFYSFKYLA